MLGLPVAETSQWDFGSSSFRAYLINSPNVSKNNGPHLSKAILLRDIALGPR